MTRLIRFTRELVVREITTLSTRPGPGGDTLLKCLLVVAVMCAFYLWVRHFEYETPNAQRAEWHKIVAAGMAGVAIAASIGEYLLCVSRRARALWKETFAANESSGAGGPK